MASVLHAHMYSLYLYILVITHRLSNYSFIHAVVVNLNKSRENQNNNPTSILNDYNNHPNDNHTLLLTIDHKIHHNYPTNLLYFNNSNFSVAPSHSIWRPHYNNYDNYTTWRRINKSKIQTNNQLNFKQLSHEAHKIWNLHEKPTYHGVYKNHQDDQFKQKQGHVYENIYGDKYLHI